MNKNQSEAQKYESFLNSRLKIDLNKAYRRKEIYQMRLRDYIETEMFIQKAESIQGDSIKMKLDLGHQFFANAEIENKDKIVLDVGLGVFVELTYKEAKDIIFQQKIELERLIRKADIDIVDIKTNIKIFENTLNQLAGLVQQ
ncbi:prefoldin subunit (macronuclear) [Tetrahymena thermophila SB210]|uniref:Prefoldin subunit n=1 Tax=Tetrahymena thermophila (strain SB210) TaxID=312017 RepID=I7LW42_TETTS|nr:prefoldin subunit [Tetrahymena thermophila SB210]EAS00800.2 prefoldin subunit [Tetrahymena thermophila SB210]|eukprot:XP_001021045.2 prefoldin subunit [Tetrahymena thermophila SB210]